MTTTNFPFTGCIVRPRDNWVLQRLAESWKIPGARVCDKPDPEADYTIWVNYALFKTVGKFKNTKCDIGYFTHYEKNGTGPLFAQVAKRMNHCISMCDQTAKHLPPEKTTVIQSSPDRQFRKEKIILGVCGREYPRKNTVVLPELRKIPGIEILYTQGNLQFDELPEWYRSIDYLLVLSSLEGGPLTVLEALAMGVPVIAPDVGWCWDFPLIRYTGYEELKTIIKGLVVPGIEHESRQIIEVIAKVCR